MQQGGAPPGIERFWAPKQRELTCAVLVVLAEYVVGRNVEGQLKAYPRPAMDPKGALSTPAAASSSRSFGFGVGPAGSGS